MDVLSEVLRVVRLSGAVHFRGEFTEPWAFSTSPPGLLAARLKVPEGSVTPFHVFIDGSCWITVGKLPATRIEGGDVISSRAAISTSSRAIPPSHRCRSRTSFRRSAGNASL